MMVPLSGRRIWELHIDYAQLPGPVVAKPEERILAGEVGSSFRDARFPSSRESLESLA
jgi:hypothetical protein